MALIVEAEDLKFSQQLNNFSSKIGTYQVALGLTNAEVVSVKEDADYYAFTINFLSPVKTYNQNLTNYKNLLRYGKDSEVLGAFPEPPKPDTAPDLVAANVEGRFRALIQRISHSPNYTKAIGEDLGIEAPETPFNPQLGKPKFTIELSSGGHPNLKWTKGKFQGVEIWKKVGGTWAKLDKDFRPDYIDKSDLPPAGQSATWTYKMIYLYKDEVVGSYSDEVSIVVTGEV